MTTEQKVTQYRSFLVRLWQEDGPAPPTAWRGEIESIQSGQHWRFDSLPTRFDLVQSIIHAEPTPPSQREGG